MSMKHNYSVQIIQTQSPMWVVFNRNVYMWSFNSAISSNTNPMVATMRSFI